MWLCGHLTTLQEKKISLDKVEVELKFGSLHNKSGHLFKLPVVTETLLEYGYGRNNVNFEASMKPEHFDVVTKLMEGYTKHSEEFAEKKNRQEQQQDGDEADEDLGEELPEIHVESIKTTDEFYDSITADKMKIRVTKNTEGQEIERIFKKKIESIAVYCPNQELDFRITISLELPQSPDELDITHRRPINIRHKDRKSYIMPGARIDVTSSKNITGTAIGREDESKADDEHEAMRALRLEMRKDPKSVTSRELEIEFNNKMLIQIFKDLDKAAGANDAFEELVGFVINSARVIVRELSQTIYQAPK